jgi:hypothetical protein
MPFMYEIWLELYYLQALFKLMQFNTNYNSLFIFPLNKLVLFIFGMPSSNTDKYFRVLTID